MPGRRTRILLADGEPLFRSGIRHALAAEDDFEVVAEVADGAEALAVALREEVDLAILDVRMSGMTGLQTVAELSRRRPELRALLLLASDGERHLVAARRAGAAGHLLRSASASELVDACRAVMRGERPGRSTAGNGAATGVLTRRETQVLRLVADGWSSQRIAEELVISVNTVNRHRQNLLEKLGLHDRVALTRYAIRCGLVEP